MERLRIRKGLKGPAYIMVLLSESWTDRALFNDVVEKLYGRDVETLEELKRAYDIMIALEECIIQDEELAERLISPDNIHEFHREVIDKYWDVVVGH